MHLVVLTSMNTEHGHAVVQFLSDDPQRDVSTFLFVIHSSRNCRRLILLRRLTAAAIGCDIMS